jgi:hypothetical protein
MENEASHRAALADFATSAFCDPPISIDGEFPFPIAILRISREGDTIRGHGTSTDSTGEIVHRLTAHHLNNLWRFEIESKKQADYFVSSSSRSYGVLKFSADADSATVLEYFADGGFASYKVARSG